MKLIKRILCIFILVSILLSHAFAYSTNTLSISLEAQKSTNYCWAACSKACIQYYLPDTTVTQSYLNSLVNIYGDDLGARVSDVSTTLYNYTTVNSNRISSNYTSDSNPTYLTYATTVSEIDSGRPILVQTQSSGLSSTNHMVLVMGYTSGPSGNQYIGFKNPWPVYDPQSTVPPENSLYRNTLYISLEAGYYGGFCYKPDPNGIVVNLGVAYVYNISN